MESSDSAAKASDSGSNGAQGDGATTTRRKLNDSQEREVTRLYAETETPVSEISKRFSIGESSVYRVAQRHGAALRGRSSTSGASKTPATTASTAATSTRTAKTAGPGRGRGRRAAAATSTEAAAPAAKAAATPSGNGRRTRATRTPRAAATAARGRPATTPGRALATKSAAAPRATGRTPRVAAASDTRRSFRVSYVAVRVFVANDMADAIRQATAAGATDITSIARS